VLLLKVHPQILQDVLFRIERVFDGFFRRLKETGAMAFESCEQRRLHHLAQPSPYV